MVQVKEKTISYKLVLNTRDDSITLEAELKALIDVKGNEITYTNTRTKFLGYVSQMVRNEVIDEILRTKNEVEKELEEKLKEYVDGLERLESLAQAFNAEIEVN